MIISPISYSYLSETKYYLWKSIYAVEETLEKTITAGECSRDFNATFAHLCKIIVERNKVSRVE